MLSAGAADPDTTEFRATVETCEGRDVVLDSTYFYPEGGGQPADRGLVGGVDVVDVQSRDGRVVHELASEPVFLAGDSVECAIDEEFRTYCMRAHTASHALYGAGRRLLDDLGYGGFDIDAERVRLDLATSTDIDDGVLVDLERLVNRVVWEGRDVSWEQRSREDALNDDDVAFNTKTEAGLGDDSIRVVTIEDWDVAACGGTHVQNTREIGPVAVLGRSNPGEGLTRIELAVGQTAIEHRASLHEAALTSAQRLDTRPSEVPEAIEQLQTEYEAAQDELDALRAELVDGRLATLREDLVETPTGNWLVGAVPGLDANGLAETAQENVGANDETDVDVVALTDEDGAYLAVATAGDEDASAVVDAVTGAFGGGGGGGPTVAQAGGLDVEADELVTFLRDYPR